MLVTDGGQQGVFVRLGPQYAFLYTSPSLSQRYEVHHHVEYMSSGTLRDTA